MLQASVAKLKRSAMQPTQEDAAQDQSEQTPNPPRDEGGRQPRQNVVLADHALEQDRELKNTLKNTLKNVHHRPSLEPAHFWAVSSWDASAWGAWDDDEQQSSAAKCLPVGATEDPDGSGFMFTSCCTEEGVGMPRDCEVTSNTDWLEAAFHCESRGGRLCTADEALVGVAAGQGCSVDGPQTATGANLNRMWTNTPCAEPGAVALIQDGQAEMVFDLTLFFSFVFSCHLCPESGTYSNDAS